MKNKLKIIKNAIIVLWNRHHFLIPPKYWKKYLTSFKRKLSNDNEYLNPFIISEYNEWLKNKKTDIRNDKLKYNPLISFIIPVYNIEPDYLKDCLDSILSQTYENFEICIADDHSTKKETIDTLKEYEEKDSRIKVVYRKENGHISKATNSALEITKGEYIALMDDDDIITKDALYKVVEIINKDKNIDMIYSDEDKLDMEGNYCEPHFKTNYAVDSFFGGNYICHFTVIKKSIFDKIGNFNQEYVGAQDFDLFLRATEVAKKIHHIPETLYHWRKVPGSTADTIENKEYAIENGRKAVEAALKRRKLDGYVTVPIKSTQYVVHYNLPKEPLVSIIFLDNNKKTLKYSVKQLLCKTNYKNIEILTNCDCYTNVDNQNIKIINSDNINTLIQKSKGQHILIISGKIKVNDKNWLKELVGYSIQKEIGAVSPKILEYSKIIKSAGLILNDKKIYVNAFSNYFIDSPGVYGRLLVPHNYSALSSKCIMFSREKYKIVKGYDETLCYDIGNIDFCLKLLQNNYRNIMLSHTSIIQKDIFNNEISETDKKNIREKWDLNKDAYYNINNSKEYPFMLEKVDKNERKNN